MYYLIFCLYKIYQQQLQQQHQQRQHGFARNCWFGAPLEETLPTGPAVPDFEFEGVARLVLLEPRSLHPPAPVLFSGTRSVTLQDI